MTHEFEITEEITVDATPEQIWSAITTGGGMDAWFMGRNEVDGRVGGRNTLSLLGFDQQSTTTVFEPHQRFATRSDEGPAGEYMAFEYLIEARDGGSTVLRFVHRGMLGDDWEAEYDGLRKGDRMYIEKLAVYVANFAGREAGFTMFLPGPVVEDKQVAWNAFIDVLGGAKPGDAAHIEIDGLEPVDGVIDAVSAPDWIVMHTDDGMYSLICGYTQAVVVQYHDYTGTADPAEIETAWRGWLGTADPNEWTT